MAFRPPDVVDLGNRRTGSPAQRDLPSPRSGEITPALSPLDAFALQSRLLAQQLEASRDNGRRMSRLPPLTIANELAKPRPGYFNPPASASSRRGDGPSPSSASSAEMPRPSPEVSRPADRPVSRYPFIQTFDDAESIIAPNSMPTIKRVQDDDDEDYEPSEASGNQPIVIEDDLDTAHPSRSIPGAFPTVKEEDEDKPSISTKLESVPEPSSQGITHAPISDTVKTLNTGGLVVPGSPPSHPFAGYLRSDHSIRSAKAESGDESDSLSIPGDPYDPRHFDRKTSNSSAFSRPRSPYSPLFAQPRSPSVSSDRSFQPRASVNFSRPLSRAGKPDPKPSLEWLVQSQTLDSPPSRPSADVMSLNESLNDSPQLPPTPWIEGATATRLSLTDDESPTSLFHPNGAPSYIYAKYSLPRGRVLSRNSVLVEGGGSTHKFEWEERRLADTNVTPIKADEKRVEMGGTNTDEKADEKADEKLDGNENAYGKAVETPDDKPSVIAESDLQKLDFRASRLEIGQVAGLQPPARSQSADGSSPPDFSSRIHRKNPSYPPRSPSSLSLPPKSAAGGENDSPQPRTPTESRVTWAANVQGRSSFAQNQMPDPIQIADSLQQLTPEGHLAMGIECHEGGELQKSTYHLRLAARGGNATAMLLYALACRHGWGMRANQAEGVRWLRKAVDSTGLEVAVDEEETQNGHGQPKPNGQPDDVVAKREHRAQLALSIYEIGVSYMNGWGVMQDKTLGLRCFEISGSWGDADALAEAGFCYAKGMGCKKDLKKAADFYRRAEKRGVGMAGNSWIYKAKYMPSPGRGSDDERKPRGMDKDKEKKPRDKSRTRTIFGGRKKQHPAAP